MPKANTPKLNDVQLVILSSASQRNDGLAVVPENVPTAPVKRALAKLTALGFLKEVRVKHDQPLWRTDEEGKRLGLKITKAGSAAIGVIDGKGEEEPAPEPKRRSKKDAQKSKAAEAERGEPRGSKRAQIIALMQRKSGATLDEMVEATGWLPHTTRAALTGLRHKAFDITKSKEKGNKTVYRLSRAEA
jgi:Protein of unknown function (DUF3489)